MRINIRVAVSGKMFSYGKHSVALKSEHIGSSFSGNVFFLFTERTAVNNRIIRIIVYVYNGGKIYVNSYSSALPGNFFA